MKNLSTTSMARLLNRHVVRRVSTSYDPSLPEEAPGTQRNEDGPYMEYTNMEIGQTEMDTYEEWKARRKGV